jgi:hypothetical protein
MVLQTVVLMRSAIAAVPRNAQRKYLLVAENLPHAVTH